MTLVARIYRMHRIKKNNLVQSGARAAALSKILNGNDEELWRPQYIPNKLIYETILDEYQKKDKSSDPK